jgi:hypothetical protein
MSRRAARNSTESMIGRTQLSARSEPAQFGHFDRRDLAAIALIAAAAAIPRLLLSISLPPLLHLDSDSYFEIAQKMWAGQPLDLSRRPPLYPFVLAVLGKSPSLGLLPVIVFQHVLGMAAAIVCYLISRRFVFVRSRAAATAAGLLAGTTIYPAVVEHSILSESLFTFLLLAAVYAALAYARSGSPSACVACGIALGCAALTRPIASGLLPMLWLIFVGLNRVRGRRFIMLSGAAFAVLVLPLCIRNYRAMGSFSLTQSIGRNLISVADRLVDYEHGVQLPMKTIYRDFLPQKRGPDAVVVYSAMPRLRKDTGLNDAQIDRALAEIAWEAIRAHPMQFLRQRLARLSLLLRPLDPSQSEILQAETYLPLLEFVGRFDPEMVARSVRRMKIADARFALAERTYRFFALDLTSGWLFLLVVIGAAALIIKQPSIGLPLAGVVAYIYIATILLQPPNARYRLPLLPIEIIFAVAGIYFAALALRRVVSRVLPNRATVITRAVLALLAIAIITTRAVAAISITPVLTVMDLAQLSNTGAIQLREVQMAGRSYPVLYFNVRNATGGGEAVTGEASVAGSASYRLEAFYSCDRRECGGGSVRITFLDGAGGEIDSPRSSLTIPLAQDRIDNDLFWDQIVREFRAPRSARRLRLTLSVQSGAGNLVVPYFAVTR